MGDTYTIACIYSISKKHILLIAYNGEYLAALVNLLLANEFHKIHRLTWASATVFCYTMLNNFDATFHLYYFEAVIFYFVIPFLGS